MPTTTLLASALLVLSCSTQPTASRSEAVPADARDTNVQLWHLALAEGEITVRLLNDVAPNHVRNIVSLTRRGHYDGLYFHRIVPGFMVQGGGTEPTGRGGPGPDFVVNAEASPGRSHDRKGLVSMVQGEGGSHSSQFFILLAPAPWLDERNTVFGEVVRGMDVVDRVAALGSEDGTTSEPVKIKKARIETRAARR